MTHEEIIDQAIREVCNTDNPQRFVEMNKTVFEVAKKALELSQPPLSSNLDEAAEEVMPISYDSLEVDYYGGSEPVYSREQMKEMFKAGAEWMADQGKEAKATIGYYNQCGLSILTEPSIKKLGFKEGDKVIVQIRKVE